jgi:hypothetical protein
MIHVVPLHSSGLFMMTAGTTGGFSRGVAVNAQVERRLIRATATVVPDAGPFKR